LASGKNTFSILQFVIISQSDLDFKLFQDRKILRVDEQGKESLKPGS